MSGYGRRQPEPGSTKKHYLYKTWDMVRQRCYNPNYSSYKNYGARGITMYDGWKDSFVSFSSYIDKELGRRPDGYTLDRIDNDKGYEPGNLRWASHSEQMHNRRALGSSKVQGVSQRKDTGKWVARIKAFGKDIRFQFDTKEEAVMKRLELSEKYYG